MAIKGVLFDFDGTLTKPGSLDFGALREAVGCPKDRPILEFIEGFSSRNARERAQRILDEFEIEAARRSHPNEGAEALIPLLRSKGLKLGIISRNSQRAIRLALENFHHIRASDFDVILTRDQTYLPKPSPEAVLAAAGQMGLQPDQIFVVGDYVFDIEAGRNAGARTVFLTNRVATTPGTATPDFTIGRLEELREILELFAPLSMGKLPNRFLSRMLEKIDIRDSSLIIKPGVGEDLAAVGIGGEEVLVLKSDPITFTADAIGTYAVIININDVATAGAVPRWLLASLLFPPGTCAAEIEQVLLELSETSKAFGVTLCGGHTEITDAVTRPVVVGHITGTVCRDSLIDKRNTRQGNRLLLTKGIALEGTCILARELSDRLSSLGLSPSEMRRCRQFLTDPGISIVREARIAAATGKVTAMHDVTEGGLATALDEFSTACHHRIRVYRDRIPILVETARICSLLNIDPMGLIGSGSLLIACDDAASDGLVAAIQEAGIAAAVIGEVLEEGEGIEALNQKGEIIPWPRFAVDEAARILEISARRRINEP